MISSRQDLPFRHSTPIKEAGETISGVDASSSSLSLLKTLSDEFSALSCDTNIDEAPTISCNDGTATPTLERYEQQPLTDVWTPSSLLDSDQSIVHKQREELQLLTSELRERDSELNSMLASHQAQISVWEQDRQRITSLSHQCTQYEAELADSKRQMKKLVGFVKLLKSDLASRNDAVETANRKMEKMELENSRQHSEIHRLKVQLHSLKIEDRTTHLLNIVNEKSSVIGQHEAREHELVTILTIKDEELQAAMRVTSETTEKCQALETRCDWLEDQAQRANEKAEMYKAKYVESKQLHQQLCEKFESQATDFERERKELKSCRDAINQLESELALSGEREQRLGELVESQRGRADRQCQELASLRHLLDTQRDVSPWKPLDVPHNASQRDTTKSNLPNMKPSTSLTESESRRVITENKIQSCHDNASSTQSPSCICLSRLPDKDGGDVARNENDDGVKSAIVTNNKTVNLSGSIDLLKMGLPSVDWAERRAVLHSSYESFNNSKESRTEKLQNVSCDLSDTPVRETSKRDELIGGYRVNDGVWSNHMVENDSSDIGESQRGSNSFNELYEKFIADLDIASNNSSFASGTTDIDLAELDVSETTPPFSTKTASPSSKLFRLLQESKEMVNKLEQTTVPQGSNPL